MIIEFFNKKNSEVEKDLAYPFMQKKALMEKWKYVPGDWLW